MIKKLYLELLLIMFFFGALWYAIAKLAPVPEALPEKFSVEKEEKLGRMVTDAVLESETEITSPEVKKAVEEISSRLISNLDSSEYHYHFYVIKKDEVNAFTFPGGNIIIFSDLIKFAESPEELAAVIAHEMGHVEKHHVVYRIMKELGVSLLVSLIISSDKSVVRQLAQMLLSTAFDREQETEADNYGLSLLQKSGIRPSVMAAFFMRLNDKKFSYDEKLELLMTHPHDKKRIQNALDFHLEKSFVEKPFTDIDWKKVKEEVSVK